MKKITIAFLVFVTAGYTFITFNSARAQREKINEGSEIKLLRKTHRALTAEMNALQNGMTNLVIAIPAGRLGEVAETAKKMKEGYIMKEVLLKEQMEEFKRSLPKGYTEIDREFHEILGKLSDSAQEKDREHVNYYYYKLTEILRNNIYRFFSQYNLYPFIAPAERPLTIRLWKRRTRSTSGTVATVEAAAISPHGRVYCP
jgi:hypothetical protein